MWRALLLVIAGCGSPERPALTNSAPEHRLDYARPFSHPSDPVVEDHCVRECAGAAFHDLAAARQLCEASDVCFQLGTILLEQGDALGARDAFERECQYRHEPRMCAALAGKYARGAFPEPYAGRAEKLRMWACAIPGVCSPIEDI